jgi:hypothetical protein
VVEVTAQRMPSHLIDAGLCDLVCCAPGRTMGDAEDRWSIADLKSSGKPERPAQVI